MQDRQDQKRAEEGRHHEDQIGPETLGDSFANGDSGAAIADRASARGRGQNGGKQQGNGLHHLDGKFAGSVPRSIRALISCDVLRSTSIVVAGRTDFARVFVIVIAC